MYWTEIIFERWWVGVWVGLQEIRSMEYGWVTKNVKKSMSKSTRVVNKHFLSCSLTKDLGFVLDLQFSLLIFLYQVN